MRLFSHITIYDILLISYFYLANLSFDILYMIIYVTASHPLAFWSEISIYLITNSISFLLAIILLFYFRKNYLVYLLVGISFGSVGYLNINYIAIGIVTVVWHAALGAFAGLTLLSKDWCSRLESAILDIGIKETAKILSLKDDVKLVLKLTAQLTLAFGAITGVCITILFRDGFDEIDKKVTAIQMVTGYAMCVASLYFWSFTPSLKLMTKIRNKFNY